MRALAWMARGVRSPARDSLLSSLAPPKAYGRAFGVERAGDNLGAVVGPLVAAWLVGAIGIRPAIWCAAILRRRHHVRGARGPPAPRCGKSKSVVSLRRAAARRLGAPDAAGGVLRVRQHRSHPPHPPSHATPPGRRAIRNRGNLAGGSHLRRTQRGSGRCRVAWRTLDRSIKPAGSLCCWRGALRRGIRRVRDRSDDVAPPSRGVRSCRIGIGLSETSESTLVAAAVPDRFRGSAFGVLGGVQAVGDVVSSLTVGVLYATISPEVAFAYAAGWMALSLVSSVFFVAAPRSTPPVEVR